VTSKQRRGEATADRILAAALDLYAGEGQKGLTMTGVMAASGVSSGSLYHHFGSLEGLATALYNRCLADLLDAVSAAVEHTRTARTGVKAMVEAYLRFADDHRAAADVVHALPYTGFLSAHSDQAAAAKRAPMARILSWLRTYIDSGEIIDLPDLLIEMLVIGPVAETTRRWLAGVPELDLAAAARALPDRIWQSVRAR
jgi:AcrR family transcriptional regulator